MALDKFVAQVKSKPYTAILPHPAHSPDLAPSDFHLFGPLKRHLGGMAFETEDDFISELRNWFDNLDVDFFRVAINSLFRAGKNASISTGITLRSSGKVNFNLCLRGRSRPGVVTNNTAMLAV
ncbi:transposase [Plakobranchus ocellatus]|uniref:Transposase n=1 Tax=Plakobranchus ocellatus TaxID=259542 RepID=A0AAV3ZDA3_9GAST|nr:transposase [Plakobranchus ocellatus]